MCVESPSARRAMASGGLTALRIVVGSHGLDIIAQIAQLELERERNRMQLEDFRCRFEELRASTVDAEDETGDDEVGAETSDEEAMEIEEDANGNERPRSYCEGCDRYFVDGSVAWYSVSYIGGSGRNLYSACARCREDFGLRSRPVEFFA